MILTTVHIERPEGTTIATGIAAQIDLAAPRLFSDEQGDRDYQEYDLYLEGVPSVGVRRRDVLVDEQNQDPLTGTNARYRVAAVETFDRDHVECRCQQIIGT